jgi:serine/threonine protein kinase
MSRPAPTIAGHVHLRLLSSAGGYGDVHLYEETALGRRVAVKVIRELEVGTDAVRRFLAEANTMAKLEHPNIVRVYGSGRTSYIAMQYCPGDTYERRVAGGPMSVAEVVSTGVRVGSAVETAHRASLLHRDIKPANILKTPWGAPGLTDFGVAHQMSGDEADSGDVGVSVPWSPPEMLYTSTNGSPASDVYSLAATLWHLLVGRPPFWLPTGDNGTMATMSRIRDLPSPRTHRSDVPESLERVLRQALSKRPEQRQQSMAAFIRDLQAVESEQRWPVTESVVTDLSVPVAEIPENVVGPVGGPSAAHGSGTVMRPRMTGQVDTAAADPQAPQRTQLRPGSSGAGGSARPPGTMVRPRVTHVDVPPGPEPTATGRNRHRLVAAGIALLLVAIVLGLVLLRRGSTPASSPPSPSTSIDSGHLEDAVPPGPVAVKGSRSGNEVTFSWDYSARQAADEFRWRVVGGQSGTSKSPTVKLSAANDAPMCLQVIVVRADGTGAARDWSAPGCA